MDPCAYQDGCRRVADALRKGVEMRRLQKAYFKSRDRGDLIASKQAEAEFDKLAKEALGE